MTESKHEHEHETDLSGSTERLLKALRSAAGDLGSSDALSELGDRARGIVAELAASARRRTEDVRPAPARSESATSFDASYAGDDARGRTAADDRSEDVPRRIHELRACVSEVADMLEATVERLETIEEQLGEPDESVERLLRDGILRCERVLMGIEHREQTRRSLPRLLPHSLPHSLPEESPSDATSPTQSTDPASAPTARRDAAIPTVLVVAAASRRRAEICVALEKQGLRTIAATNLMVALEVAAKSAPASALVVLDGPRDARAMFMEQWKDCEERGELPAAAVLHSTGETSLAADAISFGMLAIHEDHGAAAMAAQLKTLLRPADT